MLILCAGWALRCSRILQLQSCFPRCKAYINSGNCALIEKNYFPRQCRHLAQLFNNRGKGSVNWSLRSNEGDVMHVYGFLYEGFLHSATGYGYSYLQNKLPNIPRAHTTSIYSAMKLLQQRIFKVISEENTAAYLFICEGGVQRYSRRRVVPPRQRVVESRALMEETSEQGSVWPGRASVVGTVSETKGTARVFFDIYHTHPSVVLNCISKSA